MMPGRGTCLCCGRPWKIEKGRHFGIKTFFGVEPHHTVITLGGINDGRPGYGCFPLCIGCWGSLTPRARLPYYLELIEMWCATGCDVPDAFDIIRACLAGR